MTPNERAVEAVARALWRNEKWVAWDDVAPAYQAPFLAAAATLVAQITPLLTGPLQAKLDAAEAEKRQAVERKRFPVLSGGGAKVDWQLVADHGEQAKRNHYQSVESLAKRGGLSWCELFAVLHNRPWAKMDTNEAMLACRALEARYLAAIRTAPVHKAGCPGTGSYCKTGGRG